MHRHHQQQHQQQQWAYSASEGGFNVAQLQSVMALDEIEEIVAQARIIQDSRRPIDARALIMLPSFIAQAALVSAYGHAVCCVACTGLGTRQMTHNPCRKPSVCENSDQYLAS
jgi:hypothetical protein